MRVALVALSVRGAMGQYLGALVPPLSEKVELHLFVPEHYTGEVGQAKVHTFRTGETKGKALLRLLDPRGARRLWEAISAVRPDALHLFNGEGYPWALYLAARAKRAGLPLLLTLHDPEPHPGNLWEWFNAKLRRFVIPKAASLHVHGHVFMELVRRLGAGHVEVIPHGSLAPRYLRYARPGVRRERTVLFFGRIEPYKGLDLLLEAAPYLKGKVDRMVIAGPGCMGRRELRIIQQDPGFFELHNRFIPDEEVAFLFQRAAVLVLPYKQGTQSSLPLIAAGFGVPVVATQVGAFVEDVPRVGGILVSPGSSRALAEGILRVLAEGVVPVYPKELEFPLVAGRFAAWYEKVRGRGVADR